MPFYFQLNLLLAFHPLPNNFNIIILFELPFGFISLFSSFITATDTAQHPVFMIRIWLSFLPIDWKDFQTSKTKLSYGVMADEVARIW